ncbi:MAG: gamma-glutamyltransferase, partial [Terracoccus sp.]
MRVAVAATGSAALEAGLLAGEEGGNAVDAAIAAAITAMSTEPGVVSIMGGAFVNIWPAGHDPVVIDGNVEMPGRGLPDEAFGRGVRQVSTDYGGGVTMGAGHGSVANSGAVQALALARD